MTRPKVRVLVVDDSAFARKVLREVIGAHPDLEVVGTARDGADALEQIESLKPDVVTLDLVMPDLDGLGVLHALQQRTDAPPVIVVSMATFKHRARNDINTVFINFNNYGKVICFHLILVKQI